jgi:uncharacterized protein YciI
MKRLLTALFAAALLLPIAAVNAADAPATAAAAKPKQYIYMLHPAPAFQTEKAWGDKEKMAAGQHYQRLLKAAADGQVILGGRTTEAMDKTFGLVIFEAANDDAAKAFMDADPAIKSGLMTATLHPYTVAMQRK